MVETSSSGSGEGPGGVTRRGYSTPEQHVGHVQVGKGVADVLVRRCVARRPEHCGVALAQGHQFRSMATHMHYGYLTLKTHESRRQARRLTQCAGPLRRNRTAGEHDRKVRRPFIREGDAVAHVSGAAGQDTIARNFKGDRLSHSLVKHTDDSQR